MMSFNAKSTRMLITVQRPHLWLLSFMLFLLVMAFLLWLVFNYGQRAAGFDKEETTQYINDLQLQVEKNQSLYSASQQQTSMLERNSVIEDDTSIQLKQSLNEAQTELLKLKKEVAFYKNVVTPEKTKRSLALQVVQLKPDPIGGYHYKLMVSQKGRNDTLVRGTINISVEGSKEGKASTLKLSEISDQHKSPINFGMKYFQNFEGRLEIPVGFEAERLRIKVKPKTSQVADLDEKYVWNEIIVTGDENVGQ